MISKFTYFKKLSLAFAITCAVAANSGTVHAGWFGFGSSEATPEAPKVETPKVKEVTVGGGITAGKEKTSDGGTEYFVKESVYANKGAKDAAGKVIDKVEGAAENAKDAVKDGAKRTLNLGRRALDKAGEAKDAAKDKAAELKTDAKGLFASMGDSIKSICSTTWAAVRYPYDKAKDLTVSIIGNPYTDHPFLAGFVAGGFTTGVVYHYLFNKHANRQLVRNITAEDAQKVIIATAIVDYNAAQNRLDSVVAKIQAQGGANAADEANLAAAQNEVTMRYEALAALLRSQKSTLDIIKAALTINFPSSR